MNFKEFMDIDNKPVLINLFNVNTILSHQANSTTIVFNNKADNDIHVKGSFDEIKKQIFPDPIIEDTVE